MPRRLSMVISPMQYLQETQLVRCLRIVETYEIPFASLRPVRSIGLRRR
jgi:hypothetical protein